MELYDLLLTCQIHPQILLTWGSDRSKSLDSTPITFHGNTILTPSSTKAECFTILTALLVYLTVQSISTHRSKNEKSGTNRSPIRQFANF
ncbi:hypothetical protein RhiirA1_483113 [Rhizophagus irregularis]|uniref:Uncharacterized protein n=1 Tax=Rhizophagus irregularis TaxID=588596 RepID=A0A2N0QL05_9GLOM|nr:hypothetical protein RhiirA1_483113 [Rhizophagus irregularis]